VSYDVHTVIDGVHIVGQVESPRVIEDVFATVRTDERVLGQVRTTSEQVFVSDFFTLMNVQMCRKRYREEREHPEWVDIGGES